MWKPSTPTQLPLCWTIYANSVLLCDHEWTMWSRRYCPVLVSLLKQVALVSCQTCNKVVVTTIHRVLVVWFKMHQSVKKTSCASSAWPWPKWNRSSVTLCVTFTNLWHSYDVHSSTVSKTWHYKQKQNHNNNSSRTNNWMHQVKRTKLCKMNRVERQTITQRIQCVLVDCKSKHCVIAVCQRTTQAYWNSGVTRTCYFVYYITLHSITIMPFQSFSPR